MSKKSKPAISYDNATPQLAKQVNAVLAEADSHKYSVSRVYAAYNAAYAKRDQPQTCSSCLRNRVRELRKWAEGLPASLRKQGKTPVSPAVSSEVSPDPLEAEFTAFMAAKGVNAESTPQEKYAALAAFLEQHADVMTTDQRADLEAEVARQAAELLGDDTPTVEPQYTDPEAPGFTEPALGASRYNMGDDAVPIDFTPSAEDAYKGTVLYADGSKVKAGTYDLGSGLELAVQPGGKATIKHEDLT